MRLTHKKDVVILYYYSEYWNNEKCKGAIEQFDALVKKFSGLINPDIRFFKFDLAKNHPSMSKLKMAHAPIVRMYSYKNAESYKDLFFAGADETEIEKFVLGKTSVEYDLSKETQVDENVGETDL